MLLAALFWPYKASLKNLCLCAPSCASYKDWETLYRIWYHLGLTFKTTITNGTKIFCSFQNLSSCIVFSAVQCSGGQVYQECGRSCGGSCSEAWTCDDDADGGMGLRTCVPGCQCPPGLVQDQQGQCVPITMCPCVQGDKTHQPGAVIQNNCNTWYVAWNLFQFIGIVKSITKPQQKGLSLPLHFQDLSLTLNGRISLRLSINITDTEQIQFSCN